MKKHVFISSSPSETFEFGVTLGRLLKPGDIICLEGELGAGKTLLAKGIARGMGIDYPVSSPTFTLINEYPGKVPMYHFDLYRLEGGEELYDIGGEELLYGSGVSVIEWASKLKDLLPSERLWIRVSSVPGDVDKRLIETETDGDRYEQLVKGVIAYEGTGD